MSDERCKQFKYVLRPLLGSLVLLGIVFLIPYAGQNEGRSFYEIARASIWGKPGEWQAAWCSVKIILLGPGVYLTIKSLEECLILVRRYSFSVGIFLVLMILPLLLSVAGCFYLLKALF
jgi:hypothetical protein